MDLGDAIYTILTILAFLNAAMLVYLYFSQEDK